MDRNAPSTSRRRARDSERRGVDVGIGWCVQICRNTNSSIYLPCLGLPIPVVVATEQPPTAASAVPADSTPTPPHDSREPDNIVSAESNALTDTRQDEDAAPLDINPTERDLEAGPPILSPVQSDDDVDGVE